MSNETVFSTISPYLETINDVVELSSFRTVLFNKEITNLIFCPVTARGSYVIPKTVTQLGIESFSQCKELSAVILPPLLKRIGCFAFQNCINLTSITIPDTVVEISYRAFSNCIKLKSIYVKAKTPINFDPDSEVFYKVDKSIPILYVPIGSKSAYEKSTQWSEFKNIVETVY
jgi:hypothetical protein